MPSPLYQVDAFTERAYGGNPAAVCLLDAEPSGQAHEAWMQRLAQEMNLSETAFIWPIAEEAWGLRWFTPVAEVELCGHATLASAHVLWRHHAAAPDQPIRFQPRFRGELTCRWLQGAKQNLIAMDFPADPPQPTPVSQAPDGLLTSLGLTEDQVVQLGRSSYDWLVDLGDEQALRALAPDFSSLAKIDTRGIIVTAQAEVTELVDVVSRFFAPRLRIAEDPVTGSAHCTLGPYWAAKLGQTNLRCEQASERGGRLDVQVRPDANRVTLAGSAVTVTTGQLTEAADITSA